MFLHFLYSLNLFGASRARHSLIVIIVPCLLRAATVHSMQSDAKSILNKSFSCALLPHSFLCPAHSYFSCWIKQLCSPISAAAATANRHFSSCWPIRWADITNADRQNTLLAVLQIYLLSPRKIAHSRNDNPAERTTQTNESIEFAWVHSHTCQLTQMENDYWLHTNL